MIATQVFGHIVAVPEKPLYISGPMSGIPEYNVPAFKECTFSLRGEGLKVVSPHELKVPTHLQDEELWQHMMNECFKIIPTCGGIILLQGWSRSRGVRRELLWFLDERMPVYFYRPYELIDMNRQHSNAVV